MRTTVTLDPDVARLLAREVRDRGVSFRAVLNEAVRRGFAQPGRTTPVTTPVHDLGDQLVDVTHANRLADELADTEFVAQLRGD